MPFPSPLLPVMDEQERRGADNTFYEYERIALVPPVKVSILPETHPFTKFLPKGWMQGGRGTCVGHACAITSQCNYYACTQDYPKPEELLTAQAERQQDLGTCIVIYDKWYRTVFSAQWAYHISRLVGNVTYPSGSYCSAAAQAMKEYGGLPWDKVITSRTPYCAPECYPLTLEQAKILSKYHGWDGYAKITSWSGIMDAIATSTCHCVMMPINVYDVPPDSQGNLRVSGNPSGSHALPWLFVDYENKRIGCWNSWGTDYPQITWINESYWKAAGGPAFIPLDSEEALIATCEYTEITVLANIPCKFQVNGQDRPEGYTQKFIMEWESLREYEITAIPQDTTFLPETRKHTPKELKETIEFTFKKDGPIVVEPWWKALLKKLLEMIRKKPSGDPAQENR